MTVLLRPHETGTAAPTAAQHRLPFTKPANNYSFLEAFKLHTGVAAQRRGLHAARRPITLLYKVCVRIRGLHAEMSHPGLKTLFLQAPSFEGFDGGAGSRYQAKREVRSFWFPTWLAQPAA